MLHRILYITLLTCLSGCSATFDCGKEPPKEPVAVELTEGAGAVIFPATLGEQVRWLGYADSVGYWTPSVDDVRAMDHALRPALIAGMENPELLDDYAIGRPEYHEWIRTEVGLILGRLDEYRRQYVGVVDAQGRRGILMRCFPGPSFENTFEFERWKEELAIVSDGGFWYWYAVYDVESGRLVHFDSNGYA